MSVCSAAIGAGGCRKILRSPHNAASTILESKGAVFNTSTRTAVVPCSTRDATFSGVPLAKEPGIA